MNYADTLKNHLQILLYEMTDDEATLLAGIPNAPSVYSLTANPDLAEQRQQYVLQQMVKYGYLSEEEAKAVLPN